MEHQHRGHLAATAGPELQHSASPLDVSLAIDQVVVLVLADGNADIYAPWAVATLASRLTVTCALSGSTNPATVVRELGDSWATEISTLLTAHPDQTAQVLSAAMSAIQHVVDEVRQRGLAG
jgi:hypothetical protein